jgi:hypothetical protein
MNITQCSELTEIQDRIFQGNKYKVRLVLFPILCTKGSYHLRKNQNNSQYIVQVFHDLT